MKKVLIVLVFFPYIAAIDAKCVPYSVKACRNAALYNNLIRGGKCSRFEGDYGTKGCYAYSSGKYKGCIYYSNSWKTLSQMKSMPGAGKYRPVGYDCNHNANASPQKGKKENASPLSGKNPSTSWEQIPISDI